MVNVRRANGSRRDKVRARVLREETHCHLCGGIVNKQLPHGLPASPEVDEVTPVAYGGSPFDRANCRLAHRWCNRRRWHRPVEPARAELMASPPRFTAAGQRLTTALRPTTSRDWFE